MRYLVKSHLKHNGREYFEGDKINLQDKYSQRLLEIGVVEELEQDYSEWSWSKLQREASERGILKAGMNKGDVIEALRK